MQEICELPLSMIFDLFGHSLRTLVFKRVCRRWAEVAASKKMYTFRESVALEVLIYGNHTLISEVRTWPKLNISDNDLCNAIRVTGDISLSKFGTTPNSIQLRSRIAYALAQGGHREVIDPLLCSWGDVQSTHWTNGAVAGGQLPLLKWLSEAGVLADSTAYPIAAKNGRRDIIIFLIRDRIPHDADASKSAAKAGRLDMLRKLKTYNFKFDTNVCSDAITHGHVTAADWLLSQGYQWSEHCFNDAASNGHIVSLEWLLAHGCNIDPLAMDHAARKGRLEVMKWLRERSVIPNESTFDAACEYGSPTDIRWLYSEGCPVGPRAVKVSAAKGYLGNVQWLIGKGAVVDERAMNEAAEAGHSDTVVYLYERCGLKPDRKTLMRAARKDMLEVVKWCIPLIDPDCWNPKMLASAVNQGNVTVEHLCARRRCPWDLMMKKRLSGQASCRWRITGWLHETRGCPWGICKYQPPEG